MPLQLVDIWPSMVVDLIQRLAISQSLSLRFREANMQDTSCIMHSAPHVFRVLKCCVRLSVQSDQSTICCSMYREIY